MLARRRWVDAYFTLDPLSLACGRVALALVLLLDLARRAAALTIWYRRRDESQPDGARVITGLDGAIAALGLD